MRLEIDLAWQLWMPKLFQDERRVYQLDGQRRMPWLAASVIFECYAPENCAVLRRRTHIGSTLTSTVRLSEHEQTAFA
jgi:hypothetical protein